MSSLPYRSGFRHQGVESRLISGLVNLTPHPINIYGPDLTADDEPLEVIPVSGSIARVAVIELGTGLSNYSGRAFEWIQYGHVRDLPPEKPGTDYVVSLVVALACKRGDLLAPYIEVRNDEGTMIGCRFLQRVC